MATKNIYIRTFKHIIILCMAYKIVTEKGNGTLLSFVEECPVLACCPAGLVEGFM